MIKKLTAEHIFLLAIILVATVLYTFRLGSLPQTFHGDEGETALQALDIVKGKVGLIGVGWFDLPLLSFLPHGISMLILGRNIIADRLGSVIFGVLTLPFFYYFTKDLYSKRIALFATVLLATSHTWIALSRIGITYVQAAFFVLLTFFFVYKGLKEKKLFFAILGGAGLSLCFYSYFAARMVPILLTIPFVYYFFQKKARVFTIKYFLIFLFSAFLFYFPQLIFYSTHPYTFASRANSVSIFSPTGHEWAGKDKSIQEILKIHTTQTLNIFFGDNSTQYGRKGMIFDYATIIFLLVGIASVIIRFSQKSFFLLSWLVVAIVAQIFTTAPSPIFIPRFVVGLPPLFILTSLGIESITKRFYGNKKLYSIILTIIFSFIILYNLFAYFIDYPKQVDRGIAGDPNATAATKISDKLNSLPSSYQKIFLTAPFLYGDFGTIRFLSSQERIFTPAQNAFRAFTGAQNVLGIKNVENHMVFVIYPQYEGALLSLKQKYPNGVVETIVNTDNRIQAYIFTVF